MYILFTTGFCPLEACPNVPSAVRGRLPMLGSLFGSVCSIDITFDAEQNRKTAALGATGVRCDGGRR